MKTLSQFKTGLLDSPLFIQIDTFEKWLRVWQCLKCKSEKTQDISVLAQYRRRILIHSARIKHHLFKQKAVVSGHYKHKYHHPSHLPDEPVQHFLLHILIKAVPGKLLSVMFCPKLGETKRFPPILNHMGRKISWVAHDFCQSKLP